MLNFLHSVLPLKIVMLSVAVGAFSFLIVLIAGMRSDYVTSPEVIGRGFYAAAIAGLVVIIVMLSMEEYAQWRTKRELEELIEEAELKAGR